MELKGISAVVTGGASGLGEATVRRLLGAGARGVACLDLNTQAGDRLTQEFGNSLLYVQTDVSDELAVNSAVGSAMDRFGRIDVAVSAAAIGGPAKMLSKSGPIPMEKFDRVLKVNLYGTVHLMRACAARMAQNEPGSDGERGVLINVASGAAWEGQVGQMAYSASKAAIVGMTLPLARELATVGIRVMTVAPGAFDTPMYDQVPPAVRETLVAQSLFPKRMGRPDEFAMLVEEIVRNPMHNGRAIRLDAGLILSAGG
jgi:3-hydroxyacyl-CoA dehydrogenase / 3-hydroxy-2-methylbutyryl-CoA dehydrogenase